MELDFDTTMRIEQSKESLARLRGQRRLPVEIKLILKGKHGGFKADRCKSCGGPLGFNNKSGTCHHCNLRENKFKPLKLIPCTYCHKNHIPSSGLHQYHKHLIRKWNGKRNGKPSIS